MTNKSKLIGSLAAGGAALLTGRNHHSSHMGRFNDDKFGTPGYDTSPQAQGAGMSANTICEFALTGQR